MLTRKLPHLLVARSSQAEALGLRANGPRDLGRAERGVGEPLDLGSKARRNARGEVQGLKRAWPAQSEVRGNCVETEPS